MPAPVATTITLAGDVHVAHINEEGLDATRMAPRLWQGAAPRWYYENPRARPGEALRKRGFSMIVFAAVEWQPPASAYVGLEVIHAPNYDGGEPLTPARFARSTAVAQQVAEHWRRGGRVYISCQAGLNRSGLIMAQVLKEILPPSVSMFEIVKYIQGARCRGALTALCNLDFVEALLRGCVVT